MNMIDPSNAMKNPIVAGILAPILSYKRPEIAETKALIIPPGSMMIPVIATGSNIAFWMNCGNKYIDDKIIPKSIMTKNAPVLKLTLLKTRRFNTGFSSFN